MKYAKVVNSRQVQGLRTAVPRLQKRVLHLVQKTSQAGKQTPAPKNLERMISEHIILR